MDGNPRVIVVDDDEDLRETLLDYLSENGLDVFDASNGVELRELLEEVSADLVILDLRMPGEDGLSLCRYIRETSNKMGVIMLTGVTDPIDRVAGLEVGADDYVAKPFEPRELLARIRSVLRRTRAIEVGGATPPAAETGKLTFAGCTIDMAARTVSHSDNRQESLTQMETQLLQIFAERPGRILSRETLLNLTEGEASESFDRSINLRIMRLRKKVEPDATDPRFILTLRGEGYRYDPSGGND